jgi:hypothetical protein
MLYFLSSGFSAGTSGSAWYPLPSRLPRATSSVTSTWSRVRSVYFAHSVSSVVLSTSCRVRFMSSRSTPTEPLERGVKR